MQKHNLWAGSRQPVGGVADGLDLFTDLWIAITAEDMDEKLEAADWIGLLLVCNNTGHGQGADGGADSILRE